MPSLYNERERETTIEVSVSDRDLERRLTPSAYGVPSSTPAPGPAEDSGTYRGKLSSTAKPRGEIS
jgi:hypothetical protein